MAATRSGVMSSRRFIAVAGLAIARLLGEWGMAG